MYSHFELSNNLIGWVVSKNQNINGLDPIFWTFPNPYESAYVGMRQTSENDDHPDLTQCIGENKPVGYTGRLVDLL